MTQTMERRMHFARALHVPAFAWLWSGQAISALGNGTFYVALAWQVLVLTGSGTAMGLVLVAEITPRMLFVLFGGVLADRVSRRLLLLWSDGARAALVLGIAALGWLHLLQLWHLVALALCFGIAEAFFLPAYQSLPAQLVHADDLLSANAMIGFSRYASNLVGPALGATLVAISSAATAFAFDGLTFVISGLCLVAMRSHVETLPPDMAPVADADADGALKNRRGTRGILADVRDGLAYVTREPWLWITILLASLGNISIAPLQVATPRLVQDVFHQGAWLLGAILSASALGALLATIIMGQAKRVRRRGILAYAGLIAEGGALIALGLPLPHASAPAVAISAIFLGGIGTGVFEVIWISSVQEMVPQAMLGRVTSIDWMGSLCLLPVGLALMGVLTDRFGPSWVFLAGGISSAVMNAAALFVPGIRHMD
jgi:MFS family permease